MKAAAEIESLINPKENPIFFFLHVPKTGGTSMLGFFRQTVPRNLHYVYRKGKEKIWNDSDGHKNYILVTGHIKFRNEITLNIRDREIIFLSLYRNSVERVVSHYDYIRRRPHHRLHSSLANLSLLEAWRRDEIWRKLSTNIHFRYMFGSKKVGDCIRSIKEQKYIIGRTNKIQKFASAALSVMGLPQQGLAVPQRNTAANKPSFLPPARSQPDFLEACELIRAANAEEINFYEEILQDDLFKNF